MIELYENSSGDVMRFLNCKVPLPQTFGLHICPSGCGAGKSTIILEIIKKYWKEGVVVAVPTIEAAKEFQDKLKTWASSLPKTGESPSYSVIHTDNQTELVNYKEDPTSLAKFDIIVITHVRLEIDPVELFVNYKDGKRRFCLIDELINYYLSAFEIPEKIKPYVTFVDKKKTHYGKQGELIGANVYRHIYSDTALMKAALRKDKVKLFPAKNKLADYKENVILEQIAREGFIGLKNKVKDFSDELVTILFDGTADIIFKPEDKRMIPVGGSKYKSDIKFEQFPITIKRHSSLEWNLEQVEKYCSSVIELVKRQSGKTLVVTWKTIGVPKNEGNADKFEGLVENTNFPTLLTTAITNAGVSPDMFAVIHRGSGQDRGSNDYRDYENIVFYGEWNLPDNITGDINSMFGCKTDFEHYMLSLLVQTVCRLAIRQHKGIGIKVYYSSDVNENMMYRVQEYFKLNSESSCSIHGINPPFKPLSKPNKKLLVDVIFLYSLDSGIKNALQDNKPYTCNISLDKLYSVVKRARRERGLYRGLIEYLKERNITLNIT